MTGHSVQHATIVVERRFEAPPARVFAAWANQEERARWDVPDDGWVIAEYHQDFRVGGRETRTSATLCTVELAADGRGTRLTDQSAFFDKLETKSDRESGWGTIVDRLEAYLEVKAARRG